MKLPTTRLTNAPIQMLLKSIFVLQTLLFFSTIIRAQSLKIVYSQKIVYGFSGTKITIRANIIIANQSNKNLKNVKVRRRIISQMPGTENNICFGPTCYGDVADESLKPVYIAAGKQDTTFIGDYTPNGIAGTTVIQYVFFDGNNPADSISDIITFHALPRPVISGSKTFCAGGNTVLNVGSGYESCLWSNGETSRTINVNSSGSYFVTVIMQADSVISDTVQIVQDTVLHPTITGNLKYCQGEKIILDAGTGYDTYKWSNGDTTRYTNAVADTFYVEVNKGNCKGTSPTVITTENPLPESPVITSYGDTLSIINEKQNLQYQWYYNGSVIYNAVSHSYKPKVTGLYKVLAYDSAGCSVFSEVTSIILSTDEQNNAAKYTTIAYPNPAKNEFIIDCKISIGINNPTVLIYDLTGKIIQKIHPHNFNRIIKINTADLPDGFYYYSLFEDDKQLIVGKMIVMH